MDQKTEHSNSLGFKPLTEGLGLNHFADGLPYTPAHVRKKPTVQFNYPPSVPTSAPRVPSTTPQLKQAPVGTQSARQLVEQFDAEVAASAATEPQSANFLRRIVAYGLDLAFLSGMFAAIVWVSFTLNGFDLARLLSERRGVQMFWPLTLLYVVVHLGYFLIQETTWRRTIGKAIMGIRIRSSSGFATLGRAVCFFIAAIPLGIGLLWYFFDSRHRCWHDVITDCEVVLN